jgi:hypothetical protein
LQTIKLATPATTIEKISLPAGIKNFSFLSSMPNIKFVVTPEYGSNSIATFLQLIKVQ